MASVLDVIKGLNQAAANGSHDIVRLLIEAGARPNTEENDGITCLFWAVLNGNTDMVKDLLKAGADPNEKQSMQMSMDDEVLKYVDKYPLNVAAKNDYQEIIKLLIDAGGLGKNTRSWHLGKC